MLLLTIAYETPLVLPYVRISVQIVMQERVIIQIVMQERVIILFIDPLGVDHIAQLFTGQHKGKVTIWEITCHPSLTAVYQLSCSTL